MVIGADNNDNYIQDHKPPQITYNETGQKIIKYSSAGYQITGVVKNAVSTAAIKETNRVYNELFYRFNPQESLH